MDLGALPALNKYVAYYPLGSKNSGMCFFVAPVIHSPALGYMSSCAVAEALFVDRKERSFAAAQEMGTTGDRLALRAVRVV